MNFYLFSIFQLSSAVCDNSEPALPFLFGFFRLKPFFCRVQPFFTHINPPFQNSLLYHYITYVDTVKLFLCLLQVTTIQSQSSHILFQDI